MADDDAAKLVFMRNDFYRDSYRRIMRVLLLLMLVIVGLAGLLAYILMNPPRPAYFSVDPNGRITRLVPISKPNMPPSKLLQWASSAAVASFTYNFVTYKKELQAASAYFTPEGWQKFLSTLVNSTNLNAVQQKKLVVHAVITGAPLILKQGLLGNGRYAWRVQMPLLVTYQNAGQIAQQNLVVTMLIVRIDTLYSAQGIGIEQFAAASAGSLGT